MTPNISITAHSLSVYEVNHKSSQSNLGEVNLSIGDETLGMLDKD